MPGLFICAMQTGATGGLALFDVRFTPESDRSLRSSEMTLCANNDQSATQQIRAYSITSSARCRKDSGAVNPRALVVSTSIPSDRA